MPKKPLTPEQRERRLTRLAHAYALLQDTSPTHADYVRQGDNVQEIYQRILGPDIPMLPPWQDVNPRRDAYLAKLAEGPKSRAPRRGTARRGRPRKRGVAD